MGRYGNTGAGMDTVHVHGSLWKQGRLLYQDGDDALVLLLDEVTDDLIVKILHRLPLRREERGGRREEREEGEGRREDREERGERRED